MPEELKPAYKQMQAAFTKKTQELAEIRKSSEGFKSKAEAYDKYQNFIPIVEEMMASKEAKPEENPSLVAMETELRKQGYSDEAIQMMKIGANVILNQVNSSTAQAKEQARLESSIAEAEKLDPRLNDESITYTIGDGKSMTFGELVSKLVFSNQEWTKDPVSATKDAIATVDALIGRAKTEGKKELSDSAKAKSAKFPSVTSSPQSAASNSQPKTVQEAAEEARKELGI